MSEHQQFSGFQGGKNRDSGRPNFGGRDFKGGGNRDNGQTQMFSATCSNCRKQCEVPFRPSGEKPVYCRECFMKKRESAPRGPLREAVSPDFSRKSQGASARPDDILRELRAISSKLDLVLQKLGKETQGTTKQAGKKDSVVASTASKKPRKKSGSSRK